MNNNNSAKGWISCLVTLLIVGFVLKVLFRYAWIIIPVILLLNLIRSWLWKVHIKKVRKQVHEFAQKKKKEESSNYCEAEFEILDDDSEN